MIITFNLTDTQRAHGEQLIIDNVRNLRTTYLTTVDDIEKAAKILDELNDSANHKTFRWVKSDCFCHTWLLEFEANGIQYSVMTESNVYIANDQNSTIRTLNNR